MMTSRWNLNRGGSHGAPVALAHSVAARTIDVRRLFHCLAIAAAVLARRCQARTNGVCALLGFCRGHFSSPKFGSKGDDLGRNSSQRVRVLLYRNEHITKSRSCSRRWKQVGPRDFTPTGSWAEPECRLD